MENNLDENSYITGANNEQYASVTIRQNIGNENNVEMIVVTYSNVANMKSYKINLMYEFHPTMWHLTYGYKMITECIQFQLQTKNHKLLS